MANWIIQPSTGMGQTTVSATPIGTNTDYSARTATVTITDGHTTKYVKLVQNGLPHCLDNEGGLFQIINFTSDGGKYYFTIDSDYMVCFSGNNQSHFVITNESTGEVVPFGVNPVASSTLTPIEFRGVTFSLSAGTNTASTQQTSYINMYHFVWNDPSYSVASRNFPMTITQAAQSTVDYVLDYDSDSYFVESGAGETTVLGFHYTNVIPSTIWAYSFDEWILNNNDIPIDWSTSSVTVSVAENPVGLPRTATINISGQKTNGWSITGTTELTQIAGLTSLIVSPSAMNFSYLETDKNGTYPTSAYVTSNTDWVVTCDTDKFTISPTTGTGNGVIGIIPTSAYTIDAPNWFDKVGIITVSGGNATAQITATQYAFPHLEPSLYSVYGVPSIASEIQTYVVAAPEIYPWGNRVRFSGSSAYTQWVHIYDKNGDEIPISTKKVVSAGTPYAEVKDVIYSFWSDEVSPLTFVLDENNTGDYRECYLYLEHLIGDGESITYWQTDGLFKDHIDIEQLETGQNILTLDSNSVRFPYAVASNADAWVGLNTKETIWVEGGSWSTGGGSVKITPIADATTSQAYTGTTLGTNVTHLYIHQTAGSDVAATAYVKFYTYRNGTKGTYLGQIVCEKYPRTS